MAQVYDEAPVAGVDSRRDPLTPAAYQQLRRLAQAYLRDERTGHTLQATALVHEAYIRLIRETPRDWSDRGRFVVMAAHLMRQVLVDYARARRREKRGGNRQRVEIDEHMAMVDPSGDDFWIALDAALDRLGTLSNRQCRIVELRYFGGLSIEETARFLSISPKTVNRDWAAARAWLRREMGA